ncbi:hypothetical protein HDU76_008706 [Blyttiomyces sp. JEL0837]|nr:hypothetical protein HDU76_008706 [Blyttiomyces sp. JEL0837]
MVSATVIPSSSTPVPPAPMTGQHTDGPEDLDFIPPTSNSSIPIPMLITSTTPIPPSSSDIYTSNNNNNNNNNNIPQLMTPQPEDDELIPYLEEFSPCGTNNSNQDGSCDIPQSYFQYRQQHEQLLKQNSQYTTTTVTHTTTTNINVNVNITTLHNGSPLSPMSSSSPSRHHQYKPIITPAGPPSSTSTGHSSPAVLYMGADAYNQTHYKAFHAAGHGVLSPVNGNGNGNHLARVSSINGYNNNINGGIAMDRDRQQRYLSANGGTGTHVPGPPVRNSSSSGNGNGTLPTSSTSTSAMNPYHQHHHLMGMGMGQTKIQQNGIYMSGTTRNGSNSSSLSSSSNNVIVSGGGGGGGGGVNIGGGTNMTTTTSSSIPSSDSSGGSNGEGIAVILAGTGTASYKHYRNNSVDQGIDTQQSTIQQQNYHTQNVINQNTNNTRSQSLDIDRRLHSTTTSSTSTSSPKHRQLNLNEPYPYNIDQYYSSDSEEQTTPTPTAEQYYQNQQVTLNKLGMNQLAFTDYERPTLFELLKPVVPKLEGVNQEFEAFQSLTGWLLGSPG